MLFVSPGVDFFLDNFQDYKERLGIFLTILLVLTLSFSSLDVSYRVELMRERNFTIHTAYARAVFQQAYGSTKTLIQRSLSQMIKSSREE